MDGDLPPGDARSIHARTAGCIVLAERGASVDGALERLLLDRSYAPRTFYDPHVAMVELCLLDRVHETGAAWGSPRLAPSLVIIAPGDADACRAARDLVAAVQRHVPRSRVWMYADGALAPLAGQYSAEAESPYSAEAEAPASAEAQAPVARRAPMPPPRLVGVGPDPEPDDETPVERMPELGGDPDETRAVAGAPPEVTAEEISMLLGATSEEPGT